MMKVDSIEKTVTKKSVMTTLSNCMGREVPMRLPKE
jgi:hypothetical protein